MLDGADAFEHSSDRCPLGVGEIENYRRAKDPRTVWVTSSARNVRRLLAAAREAMFCIECCEALWLTLSCLNVNVSFVVFFVFYCSACFVFMFYCCVCLVLIFNDG